MNVLESRTDVEDPYSISDGDRYWTLTPDYSPKWRYRALQNLASLEGEDWREYTARRSALRPHTSNDCATEIAGPHGYCWCSEWDGPAGCLQVCERDEPGAMPAWEIEAR